MGAEVELAVRPPPTGKRRSTTLLHLLQLEKPDGGVFVFTAAVKLPLPPPSPEPEAESLIDKIDSCCRVFTFAPGEHCSSDERDLKRARLAEILAAVRSSGKAQNQAPGLGLDHRVMSALVKMFAANLFRAMPPPASSSCPLAAAGAEAAPEEFPSAASPLPSWPHLSAVYEILLAAVAAADAKSLRAHVDRRFLTSLLALFASEDPRERDRLKAAYHALYSKLTPERAFMRRSMANALLRFAHEPSAPSSSAYASSARERGAPGTSWGRWPASRQGCQRRRPYPPRDPGARRGTAWGAAGRRTGSSPRLRGGGPRAQAASICWASAPAAARRGPTGVG